jgi:hypothetical protein
MASDFYPINLKHLVLDYRILVIGHYASVWLSEDPSHESASLDTDFPRCFLEFKLSSSAGNVPVIAVPATGHVACIKSAAPSGAWILFNKTNWLWAPDLRVNGLW